MTVQWNDPDRYGWNRSFVAKNETRRRVSAMYTFTGIICMPLADVAMMTSSIGNIFRVADPLCREFAGSRWIPLTKASEWRGAVMFSLICAWTNGWAISQDTGDMRRHRAMTPLMSWPTILFSCLILIVFWHREMISNRKETVVFLFLRLGFEHRRVPHTCVGESGQHWFR